MDTTMHAMPPAAEACYTKIGPSIHEWELRNLVKLVVDELHPHHVVELGTYRGGFAALFSHICTGRMISVDKAPQGLAEAIEAGIDRLHFITGDTHHPNTVKEVTDGLDRPIDLLFVDAGHMLDEVRCDFEAWRPHVRPGGWIVFHDIEPGHVPPCQVNAFWITLEGKKREFIATGEITKFKGPPPSCGGIGILEVP